MTRVLTLGKYSSIHLITFVRAHITSVLYNAEDKPGPSDEVGSGRKHPDPGSETDSLSGDAGGRIHARGSEQQGNAAEGGTGPTRQIDTQQSTISVRIATVVRMVTVTAARIINAGDDATATTRIKRRRRQQHNNHFINDGSSGNSSKTPRP